MTGTDSAIAPIPTARRPRLGFLGLGWIGRHRLAALAAEGSVDVIAVADPSREAVDDAVALAPGAARLAGLEELLARQPDGIVIATPSAGHAEQAIAVLERGIAVFCQKPLARTREETARVLAAARQANRPLGVDFSYRHVAGLAAIRGAMLAGELGEIYAMDLSFHNAYGPDKSWFYELRESGGGCAMDLGVHLVDLALWMSGERIVESIDSRLFRHGRRLRKPVEAVEDYATAQLDFGDGGIARIACSWGLSAGQDAIIEFAFHGTRGGAALRNVEGSFHDFVAERFRGTQRRVVARYPDAWGGRALLEWAGRLAAGEGFSPESARLETVAAVLDEIYGRTGGPKDGWMGHAA